MNPQKPAGQAATFPAAGWLRACFVAALLLLACGGARAATLIAMPPGAQRVLVLDAPINRIVIAERGIVEATVLNDRQLQLVALAAGRTTMTLFTTGKSDGTVYDVQVSGTPAAAGAATGAPRGDAAALLRADPDLRDVRIKDGTLQGSVPDLAADARAVGIARSGGARVTDLTHVRGNQMVAVEIRFAAVSVTTMQALGFNFMALGHGIQGALAVPNSISAFNLKSPGGLDLTGSLPLANAFSLFLGSSTSNALGMVSVLSSAGLMQLLAEPTLLVRSGDRASFMAGGDVPIPVPQGGTGTTGGVTIEYHPYGVRLVVEPVVLSDRRILLRVSPEVSEIDNSNALSFQGYSVPAFRRRSTSTTVELGDGQSFVLAGLIYNNSTYTESKVPWLGDIPILGNFFKITQNAHDRQELVVIATPHLVSPMDPKSIPSLPGAATRNLDRSFGDIILNNRPLDRTVAAYGITR